MRVDQRAGTSLSLLAARLLGAAFVRAQATVDVGRMLVCAQILLRSRTAGGKWRTKSIEVTTPTVRLFCSECIMSEEDQEVPFQSWRIEVTANKSHRTHRTGLRSCRSCPCAVYLPSR